jgi:hypothetical protein
MSQTSLTRYRGWRKPMSNELLAFGVIVLLFSLIALMPSFDGEWTE